MDTDLEMIIKDKSLLLPPGAVKAYSLMILQVSDEPNNNYFRDLICYKISKIHNRWH